MKDAKRNWKTTVSGILTLAFAGLAIWQNPLTAADPQVIAAIVSGVGLVVAKDGNVTGAAPAPEAPKKAE